MQVFDVFLNFSSQKIGFMEVFQVYEIAKEKLSILAAV